MVAVDARRALVVGLLALAVPALAAPLDLEDVRKRGALRVLTVPPSGFAAFLAVNAFDVELLESFARANRLRLEKVEVPTYGELVPALVAGRGDVIAGGFTSTEERRRQIDFTVETLPSRMVVVTRKPHRVIRSLGELKAERLGTERGTSWAAATLATGVPAAQVDDGIRMEDLPAAMKSGKITAAVFELHVAVAAQVQDRDLQLGLVVGPPGSLGYGVRKEDAGLLRALNEHIELTRRTGHWNRYVVKYFGELAPEVLKRQ